MTHPIQLWCGVPASHSNMGIVVAIRLGLTRSGNAKDLPTLR